MTTDSKKWTLIQRYIVGSATAEERKILDHWMEYHPENRKLVRELEMIWKLTPGEDFEVDVEKAWNQFKIRQNGKDLIKSFGYTSHTYKTNENLVHIFRAAAVILVAFFAGFFVQHHLNTTERMAAEQSSNFNALQELETERGEKARVTFSDGTRVTLNSSSTVKFPEEFHGSIREVHLDGEAFFEVAHEPGHPFIVHSQDAKIEVLGTEFNVRGWSEDASVEVVVRGGEVSVQSVNQRPENNPEIILTEGYKTQLDKGQLPIAPQKVDVRNHLLWTSGGMYFDNESFSQVVRDLERRFNVHITVSDLNLMEVPYTGTFQYAELDEVLSVIAASMEVGYNREGSEIEFH